MKILLSKLLFISTVIILVSSCTKDQSMEYLLSSNTPVLSASQSGTIPLSSTTKANIAVTFSWTNPNYMFASGVSSQNVNYLLEIDTLGSNFTNPNRVSFTATSDLSMPLVDSVLNSALSNTMLLTTGFSHTIQVRVTASVNGATATNLVSNVLQFKVTPWSPPPAINPPKTGVLYIVGSAVAGGWSNPIAAGNLAAQTFTKSSNTLYTITIPLIGGGEFKLIDANDGSWTDQWSTSVADAPSTNGTPFPFVYNGANAIVPASGGKMMTVDFQHGTITIN